MDIMQDLESVFSIAYIRPVAESRIERLFVWSEQVPDVTKTGDLKNLWLLLNHLPARVDVNSHPS